MSTPPVHNVAHELVAPRTVMTGGLSEALGRWSFLVRGEMRAQVRGVVLAIKRELPRVTADAVRPRWVGVWRGTGRR